jgi:hypothetical protein
MGWVAFDLIIAGGAYPRNIRLAGYDTQRATEITLPPGVSVAPGQQVAVPVRVRPVSRRWFGATLERSFGVTLNDDGGGPGSTLTLTGQYDDLPRGWPVVGPIMAVAAGAIVPVALVAAGAFGGGDGGGASPGGDDTPTRTATSRRSPTSQGETPSRTADGETSTPTDVPPTATPTQPPVPPTETPTPTAVPYIEGGNWDYSFVVRQNTCGFGLQPGEEFAITYTFEDVGGDGYVDVGELVDIYDESGSYAGRFTFTYPTFSFGYPVVGNDGTVSGRLTVDNTYSSPTSGGATLTEIYDTNPQCSIFGSE